MDSRFPLDFARGRRGNDNLAVGIPEEARIPTSRGLWHSKLIILSRITFDNFRLKAPPALFILDNRFIV